MKSITIKINTENAAFQNDPDHTELRRILKTIPVFNGYFAFCDIPIDKPLLDINGNKCGSVTIE